MSDIRASSPTRRSKGGECSVKEAPNSTNIEVIMNDQIRCQHCGGFTPIDDELQKLQKKLAEAEAANHHMQACRSLLNVLDDETLFIAIDRLRTQVETLKGALSEALKLCRCKGTGKIRTNCTQCGDSTWDHECDDKEIDCERCVHLRSAKSAMEGI